MSSADRNVRFGERPPRKPGMGQRAETLANLSQFRVPAPPTPVHQIMKESVDDSSISGADKLKRLKQSGGVGRSSPVLSLSRIAAGQASEQVLAQLGHMSFESGTPPPAPSTPPPPPNLHKNLSGTVVSPRSGAAAPPRPPTKPPPPPGSGGRPVSGHHGTETLHAESVTPVAASPQLPPRDRGASASATHLPNVRSPSSGDVGSQINFSASSGTLPSASPTAKADKKTPEDLRADTVVELINTEDVYVQDLLITTQVFMDPLRKSDLLSAAEMNALFSNLEVITNLNKLFLTSMRDKYDQAQEPNAVMIGQCFVKMGDHFKHYLAYCSNQPLANETFNGLKKKNSPVLQFLATCEADSRCRGLQLFSFLIKPVQRICKYPLLLRELIKYTSEDHPDYADLLKAREKIDEIVDYINEGKRSAEGMQKMLDIQNCIESCPPLVMPTRRFLREQTMELKKGGKPAEVILYLFNDLLVVAKGKSKGASTNKLIVHMNLGNARLLFVADTDKIQNGFELEYQEGKSSKNYVFVAPSAAERDAWFSELKSLINDLKRKQMTGGQTARAV